MMTFRQFLEEPPSVSTMTAWYLADVAEALGKQELFTKQAPQKLKALREHALIESAISSNRIEGVEVEHKRIGTIVGGKAALRDRDDCCGNYGNRAEQRAQGAPARFGPAWWSRSIVKDLAESAV